MEEKPTEDSYVILDSFNGYSMTDCVRVPEMRSNHFQSRSISLDVDEGSMISNCGNVIVSDENVSDVVQENQFLREALKKNNILINEQFEKIKKWQSDVVETHRLHKIKFDETKDMIKKLRCENGQLKRELESVKMEKQSDGDSHDTAKSVASLKSTIEELNTRNKDLTEENAKLASEYQKLKNSIYTPKSIEENNVSINSDKNNDEVLSNLKRQLTESNAKLLQSEDVKLNYARYKQSAEQRFTTYELQIKELKMKLQDSLTLVLKSTGSTSKEFNTLDLSNDSNIEENKRHYDQNIKGMARIMNNYIEQLFSIAGYSERLLAWLNYEESAGQMRLDIQCAKNCIDNLHKIIEENNDKLKSHVTYINKIFDDYETALISASESSKLKEKNMTQLNEILELQSNLLAHKTTVESHLKETGDLRKLVETLQKDSDERDHLRAQLDVYKTDFETERDSRTLLANERQQLIEQVRTMQVENQRLRNLYMGGGGPGISRQRSQDNEQREITPPPIPYMCPICQSTFRTSVLLQNHVEMCLDNA